jgi:hypothetical protein
MMATTPTTPQPAGLLPPPYAQYAKSPLHAMPIGHASSHHQQHGPIPAWHELSSGPPPVHQEHGVIGHHKNALLYPPLPHQAMEAEEAAQREQCGRALRELLEARQHEAAMARHAHAHQGHAPHGHGHRAGADRRVSHAVISIHHMRDVPEPTRHRPSSSGLG